MRHAAATLETTSLVARDGQQLGADWHHPAGEARAVAVLAPAMGVQRTFYRALAGYLADAGIAVLAVDYRGIGESTPRDWRRFGAALHDWGELDLGAAIEAARHEYADPPLLWVGHSVGGQLFGLLKDPPVSRALLVASQSGYWRHWRGLGRAGMFVVWHALVPVAVRLAGRLPMRALGQGEDVPAGVALQWAEWGRDPGYIQKYAGSRDGIAFRTFRGPLRAYGIADDPYAPHSAVAALVRMYETPCKEQVEVRPADLGLKALGHFGGFRPRVKETLWRAWRDWLLES